MLGLVVIGFVTGDEPIFCKCFFSVESDNNEAVERNLISNLARKLLDDVMSVEFTLD
jgi:hypothetical protein